MTDHPREPEKPMPNPPLDPRFRLDGKPFEAKPTRKVIACVQAILSALPNNELLSTRELSAKSGYSLENISSNVTGDPAIQAFKVTLRYPKRMVVWGNKKTIAELSKHKEVLA